MTERQSKLFNFYSNEMRRFVHNEYSRNDVHSSIILDMLLHKLECVAKNIHLDVYEEDMKNILNRVYSSTDILDDFEVGGSIPW